MKKLVYIFLIASLAGCVKHDVNQLFNKLPEERMKERNAELQNKLLEGTNGWKAFLRTSATGNGYGFYMKFSPLGEVQMYADWNNASAATSKTSTYRIMYVMNTQLSFDTYNYISILQDPQTSVNGGVLGSGLQSDIEFEYIRSSADSVILRGKKYRNYLYMMKASASEATQYNNGGYATAITNFNTWFATHSNNYFVMNTGGTDIKVGITFSGKTSTVQGKKADNSIVSDTRGYGYSIDGVYFTDAIQILGVRIISIKMKDANTMVAIDEKGKEYPILQNPTPLTDFTDMFGSTKTYNAIKISGSLPLGVTSDFNSIYAGMISRFGTVRVDSVLAVLTNSSNISFRIHYYSTGPFLAEATYTYTLTAGILTLTSSPTYSANWNTRATAIGDFATWIQSGPFKIDWVSSTAQGVPTLGGLYKVSKPSDFFYGQVLRR